MSAQTRLAKALTALSLSLIVDSDEARGYILAYAKHNLRHVDPRLAEIIPVTVEGNTEFFDLDAPELPPPDRLMETLALFKLGGGRVTPVPLDAALRVAELLLAALKGNP